MLLTLEFQPPLLPLPRNQSALWQSAHMLYFDRVLGAGGQRPMLKGGQLGAHIRGRGLSRTTERWYVPTSLMSPPDTLLVNF